MDLLSFFESVYRYLILPVFAGVWWLIRKISGLEQEVAIMKREAAASENVLRAELRLVEAKVQGQIDISSAHHATTQQQQETMMKKLDSIEAYLRERATK
jgi:hypothetical protein